MPPKTLHVCYSFPPDPPGGTEVYVHDLCRELGALGYGIVVTAPGPRDDRYEIDGLAVRRFEHVERGRLADAYEGNDETAARFASILDEETPDIVHQHALTPACSAELAVVARQRGCGVVFTYHTPTASCQRGTLLERGRTVCDGRMDVDRCTACTLDGLGVGVAAGEALARVPQRFGGWLAGLGLQGGAWTALRMTELVARRQQDVRRLFGIADAVIALAPWTRDLLLTNGVAPDKISYIPHGIARAVGTPVPRPRAGRLRVVHLGRLDPVKGTGVLLHALRTMPGLPIDLDVYGVQQTSGDRQRLDEWQAAAAGDARIRFLRPVPPGDVVSLLAAYDVVAVPSQWLETGPLVVLEAFAAGRPVIGSALGGVADKVSDGVNGLLVRPYESPEAWAAALGACLSDPSLVQRLAAGVTPPRAMAAVAGEMDAVYRRVLTVGSKR